MTVGGGDALARGARSAQFEVPHVTEEKWKEMFGDSNSFEERMRKKALEEGLTEQQYDEQKQAATEAANQAAKAVIELRKQELETSRVVIKFRAVQDRVVVRRAEAENKTDAGLFLADDSKEKPSEGIVVAVGPGLVVNGVLQPVSVQIGETVVFGKFAGQEVKIGLETLLVLREEDIFIVKENK